MGVYRNYKIQTLFNKYFTYGTNKNQVNVTHVWYDSFTKVKKISPSPTIDALSSFFNYGVACSRIVNTHPILSHFVFYCFLT